MTDLISRLIRLVLAIAMMLIIGSFGTQDIFSCGGFVRSKFPIDFSKIWVKLYTEEGSLKYETDCAPNNGYYMIPVYSKGNYQLKVHPPPGWLVEPEVVVLKIDGTNDQCSRGEDANFEFKGFTVEGKVTSSGSDDGPEDFKLMIYNSDKSYTHETSTLSGGGYLFKGVPPGSYKISGMDPTMCMGMNSVDVTVKNDRINVKKHLQITGYSLSGLVESERKPTPGVAIILYSDSSKIIQGCQRDGIPSLPSQTSDKVMGMKPACMLRSGLDGRFRFTCVPSGHYILVPFLKSGDVTFDVHPKSLAIHIDHGPLHIKEPFAVKGFSVSGRVLWASKGQGIGGAEISVNGKRVTASDKSGKYVLEQVVSGDYTIDAKYPRMKFNSLKIAISPTSPVLPDLVPHEFEICGSVIIDRYPESLPKLPNRKLLISPVGASHSAISVTTGKDGSFCRYLSRGKYTVEPQILPAEKTAGLSLLPSKTEITLGTMMVPALKFEQFKAKLSGTVKCKTACNNVKITLKRGSAIISTAFVNNKNQFHFDDLLPDTYVVSASSPNFCWDEETKKITIENRDVSDVVFVQSGFSVNVATTHKTNLRYRSLANKSIKSEVTAKPGANVFCVPEPGVFEFEVDSCHRFQDTKFTVDASKGDSLNLVASLHRITGMITIPEKIDDLYIIIRSRKSENGEDSPDELERRGPLSTTTTQRPANGTVVASYKYPVTYHSTPRMPIEFEPTSSLYLFSPERQSVDVADDCISNAFAFKGEKGLFLDGKITPPLAGVEVEISKDGEQSVFKATTDASGTYRIGPLRSFSGLSAKSSKPGYILTPKEGKLGHFTAAKLSELTIAVLSKDDEPLAGVLVSVSGGISFRSNNLTETSGSLTFVGLAPGDYFVRPILKEFSFEPPTRMVKVSEGTEVDVKLVGRRVAFSCFGLVRTFNGQPVPSVPVEAISANCDNLQEESVTSQDGGFRIRGLQPECSYSLRLKRSGGNILRSVPDAYTIQASTKDILDKDIVILPEINTMEVIGNIKTAEEYLPTLKVLVSLKDDPDTALHSVPVRVSSVFFLPSIDIDNKFYIARLETSLNPRLFEPFNLPQEEFQANSSFHLLEFRFNPVKRRLDAELSRGTYILFPVAIICVLLIHYRAKLLPIVQEISQNGMDTLQRYLQTPSDAASRGAAANPSLDDSAFGFDSSGLGGGGSTAASKRKVKSRRT